MIEPKKTVGRTMSKKRFSIIKFMTKLFEFMGVFPKYYAKL